LLAEEILSKEGTFSFTSEGFLIYSIGGTTLQSTEKRPELGINEKDLWKSGWKKTLWYWACYFPVTRTKVKNQHAVKINASNEIAYKYCIKVKLPGFNTCNESAKPYQLCEG